MHTLLAVLFRDGKFTPSSAAIAESILIRAGYIITR